VKPPIVFIRGPEKEQWIQENNSCGGLYKIGFVQGPQKLNDGSGKMIHLGTIGQGAAVCYILLFTITGSTMTRLQLPKDPTELSYWVAQAMPLIDEQRLSLLQINSPIQRLRWELCVLEKV
jgi:hypothetical protein